jgi:succinate dehydrogenase / fumarate reductase cytochrome b subunit
MGWVARTLKSSIGAKAVMALSGILLFGFVVVHLLGNLQVFGAPEAINHYGQALRDLGPILWVVRIGLLAVAAIHVFTALKLVRANQAARPVPYAMQASRQIKPATRLMWTSGLVLVGYTLFHLAHFTWGFVLHDYYHGKATLADGRVVHDVHSMMVRGFQVWWVSAAYLLSMLFLALHLCHAVPSFFQTLGVNHPKYQCLLRLLGPAIATVIFLGYASIPAGVWLGAIRLAGGAP